MKKILVLIMCAVLVLGLFAGCGGEGGTKDDSLAGKFSVGYAKVDVTPKSSMAMGGYTAAGEVSRMAEGTFNELCITCIAMTDEAGVTMLMMTCDALQIKNQFADELRNKVSEATGVPVENIVVAATHSHSTPGVDSNYVEFYDGIVKAAQDALADRAPATMEYAAGEVQNLSYVRHYNTHTGIVTGSNFKPAGTGMITGHTTESDKEMRLVRYTREGEGKKPVLMANWQAHPCLASGSGIATHYMYSSDYIGFFRDYVEQNSDCLVAFFQGAAGNLNTGSKLDSEKSYEDTKEYGEELGKAALALMENMNAGDNGALQVRSTDIPNSIGGTTKISAISAGGLGIMVAPFEMFDTTAMAVRAESPYQSTFTMALANGYNTYVPTAICYDYIDCYEVRISQHPKGTAENIVTDYLNMLNEMHG